MCYALSRRAASAAGWLFEQRKTKKVYLALVEGHMASATAECSLPIADDPSHDFKMMAGTAEVPGRAAHTMVVRLAVGTYQGRPVSKVELHPSSGRRHQLRVHCLSLGHPIVGDATYNDDGDSPRMMLHAWKLTLPFSLVPAKRRGVRSTAAASKRRRNEFSGGSAAGRATSEQGEGIASTATRAEKPLSPPMAAAAAAAPEGAAVASAPVAIPAEDVEITSADPFLGLLDAT
jgi:hypothetical protein